MNVMKTGMLLAALTAVFMGVGFLIGGSSGAVIAFFAAAAMNAVSYWNADKLVLRMHNAREVDAHSAPDFHAMVAELARRANLPMPRVYVIDSAQPNAFATGRNPQNAAVAVSTGLLQSLTYDEIAGVMAHELAHVRNRDTLIMTVAATIAGAVSMLANFAFFFGGNRDNNNPLGFVGVLVAAITAPIAAMLIQTAISRTREYSADRDGAAISGKPLALASALARIAGQARRLPMPSAERNPATAALFIVNPLSGERMDNLFSTHPATENRIAALQALSREAPAVVTADPWQGTSGPDGAAGRSAGFVPPQTAPAERGRSPWSRAGMARRGPWS